MKNRSRIIHACTCKDPHVLHFLKISALSRVFPQEMDIKITACSRVWGRIMHVALLDFHACIRKYSSLCDACTRMSVCGNTCVYTHSISRIYMRFYEDHVWLGIGKLLWARVACRNIMVFWGFSWDFIYFFSLIKKWQLTSTQHVSVKKRK